MYRERINEIIKTLSESEDFDCLDLFEELIDSASEYVRRVNLLEIAIMVGKFNKDGEEYRENTEKLDKLRSTSHNTLISNVKIINRLCKKHNLPLLFKGDEEKRIEVAEFSQQIVDEIFTTRRL